MNFKTHNVTSVETCGSCLQGTVQSSTAELIHLFGAPEVFEPGEKVRLRWALKFDDGKVATIYDYKDERPLVDVTDWHIGGFDEVVATRVKAIVEVARESADCEPADPSDPIEMVDQMNDTTASVLDSIASVKGHEYARVVLAMHYTSRMMKLVLIALRSGSRGTREQREFMEEALHKATISTSTQLISNIALAAGLGKDASDPDSLSDDSMKELVGWAKRLNSIEQDTLEQIMESLK